MDGANKNNDYDIFTFNAVRTEMQHRSTWHFSVKPIVSQPKLKTSDMVPPIASQSKPKKTCTIPIYLRYGTIDTIVDHNQNLKLSSLQRWLGNGPLNWFADKSKTLN
jgi:hypothetical protein